MSSRQEFYQQEDFLKKCINMIKECHQKILSVYDCDDFEVISKEDKSPITEADRLSNEHICHFLQQLKINHSGVISEENKVDSYQKRKSLRWTWLVDPLDGTKEFVKKNGQFTVNVGLCDFGVPVFGIVGIPVSGDIYYGVKDIGSFKISSKGITPLVITPKDLFVSGVRVVASSSHMNENTQEYIKTRFRDPKIINIGSSLKLLWVAEGKADIYPRMGPTSEWDTCAAHSVIKYAGGHVLDMNDSEELIYNKENLLNPFFIVH